VGPKATGVRVFVIVQHLGRGARWLMCFTATASEYLKEHGMVDMVVHRHELRATLSRLCHILTKTPPRATQPAAPARMNGPMPAAPG